MNLILTSVVAVFKPPVTVMMMSWIIKRTYEIHVGPIPAATKHFSVGYVEVEGIVVNEMTSCSGSCDWVGGGGGVSTRKVFF
ncbi:unnamed protein product [Brassica napus]|uniref:(rape) hypothetical protein n=1 Tax=Brassica napus TaxID=3708 RepID=A0A816J955_BRANA|nr:unnamed protein product [Brassica napus]